MNEKLIEDCKDNLKGSEAFAGVKTGFDDLDHFTDGFANGQLIVMGGRPGMGKTAFACSLINNVCINGGKSCIFFSADMQAHQVGERLIRLRENIRYFDEIGESHWEQIKKSAVKIGNAKLWIDGSGTDNCDDFIENCREVAKKDHVDLIIIDCLQILDNNLTDMYALLMKLKRLAVELACPVFVLTQINRSVEKRNAHIPRISDLPNAEIMTECVDEILFLYRPAYYDWRCYKNLSFITIAKHRKCQKMNASIYYNPDIPAFGTKSQFSDVGCDDF